MKRDITVHNAAPVASQDSAFALSTEDFRRSIAMDGSAPSADTIPWGRYLSALWRYKFLALALFVAGGGVAYMVAKSIPSQYETGAGIWVRNMARADGGVSPLRAEQTMTATAWMELIRSEPILDSVVKKLRLNIRYHNPADSALFRLLATVDPVPTGRYTLETDSAGTNFTLRDRDGMPLSTGMVGDSIAPEIGFLWAPEFIYRPGPIHFDLVTLRDAAVALRNQLNISLLEQGGLMRIGLTGSNPKLIAATVNQVVEEFLAGAEYLSKANQMRVLRTVSAQKEIADTSYKTSLLELERFRVENVFVPTQVTPTGGGSEGGQNILLAGYTTRRAQQIELEHDIRALDSTIAKVAAGQDPNAFLAITSVATEGRGVEAAVVQYQQELATLQAMTNTLTPTNEARVRQRNTVDGLLREAVLPAARALRETLQQKVVMLNARLQDERAELRDIPVAVMRDGELQAELDQRLKNLDLLRDRESYAQMAVMSAVPDVQLGFHAVEPSDANSDAALRAFAMILMVSLAAAVAIPILLDRLDKKFRYPDQAMRDLGLTIIGTVPKIRKIKNWQANPAVASAVVEAFRTIRLALGNAFAPGEPITVAISSPGMGEGKSLVSENLALALSEGGYRTLLIDGDTRRGELHATFGAERRPGLLDHLSGKSSLSEVVQKTSHDNLWMMAAGTRFRHGPELLMAPSVRPMFEELRARFDAIVIDTPPLSAGVDAYVLATAVSNMVLVLRTGKSDRKLAEAKLELLDRLPVRVIGAVLNGVDNSGAYQYYSYMDGYAAEAEEDEAPYIAAPGTGTAITTKRR